MFDGWNIVSKWRSNCRLMKWVKYLFTDLIYFYHHTNLMRGEVGWLCCSALVRCAAPYCKILTSLLSCSNVNSLEVLELRNMMSFIDLWQLVIDVLALWGTATQMQWRMNGPVILKFEPQNYENVRNPASCLSMLSGRVLW